MRFDPKYLLAIVFLGAMVFAFAQARHDPNDVPHDPHPLTAQKESTTGQVLAHGPYVYVTRDNRLYRVREDSFDNRHVEWVDLP